MKKFIFLFAAILSGFNTCFSQWIPTDGPYEEINVQAIIPYDSLVLTSTGCGYFTKNEVLNPWKMNSDFTFSGHTRIGDSLFIGGDEIRMIDLANPDSPSTIINSIALKILSHSDTCMYGGNYKYNPFSYGTTGFFKSNDNGITWTGKKAGLPIDSFYNSLDNTWYYRCNVTCISVTSNYIFCGTLHGIFRNTGNLGTWVGVNSGLPNDTVTFIEAFNDTLFAAFGNNLYTSSDFGNNWSIILTTPSNITSFYKSGFEYYAGTIGNGIYLSTNQGSTWNLQNAGLTDMHVTTISAFDSSIICGTSSKGVFYYQGGQWINNISGMVCSYVRDVACTDSLVYSNSYSHVYVMNNNSQWSDITPGNNNDKFINLDKKEDTIYVSSFYQQSTWPYVYQNIFYSPNIGASWNQISSLPYTVPGGNSTHRIYIHNKRLYGYSDEKMYSTKNLGVSWLNLSLPGQFCNKIRDFLIFDTIPLAAACGSGEVLKLDSNQQWVLLNNGLPANQEPVSLAYCNNALFTYLDSDEMYVSFNNGNNWVPASSGLVSTFGIRDFVSYGPHLFVTTDFGVFVTSNYGQNWYPINDGLKNLNCGGIKILHDTLYVGTYGNGVWKRPIVDIGLGIHDNQLLNEFVKIFPNPFSSQTTVQTNKTLKNAILTVYNVWGQIVKQTDNLSGTTIIFQRDNLPGGLYFIRLTQDDKTILTDKLIITD